MANYSELLNDINAAIYENNDQEIDALEVRAILREMVTSLGSGFLFKGIATPSSPGTSQAPDQNVFYLATTAGTYTYLGGLQVSAGEVAFLCYDGSWTKKSSDILSAGAIVDNLTTNDATKPLSAKQGKVLKDGQDATSAEVTALGQEVGEINLFNLIDAGDVIFEQGSFGGTGVNLSSATRIRTDRALSTHIGWIGVPDGFLIHEVYYYSSWNSNSDFVFVGPYKTIGKQSYFVDTTQPLFRFSIRKANNTAIVPDDYISLLPLLSQRFIPLESAVSDLGDKDENLENSLKALDASLYGGEPIVLPTALKGLSLDTSSRKIKYENGVFSIWINGVAGANIQQADADIRTKADAFIVVDRAFWEDDSRGLVLPVVLSASQSVYIQILYKYAIDGSVFTRDVTLTASGDVDVKSQIKAALPTGYKNVTLISLFSLCATSSPYGENSISTSGFKLIYAGSINQVSTKAEKGFAINPFRERPYLYHFDPIGFIVDGLGHPCIAGESLEDIIVASRLGYSFIEANIHKTSDDNYVVLHGVSGKFGGFVKSNNPSYTDELIQQMYISSVTLDFIKQNIRYNSYFSKYQTQIPSLDEFLEQCRTFGLGVVAGVLQDETATKKCIDILGNNLIVYSAPNNIRNYFNGYCDSWFNTAGTDTDAILSIAESVGAPYIAFLGQVVVDEMISESTLEGFIATMHENGFLVGTSYYDEETGRMLQKMGVDVFTTTKCSINRFEANYEVIDLDGDAAQFTTTGSISGGVATLASSDTLSFGSDDIVPLGKASLTLRFNGSLTINFGSQGSRTIVSDGSEDIMVTDYFFRRETKCIITATAATEITGLVYLTSKC